MWLRNNKNREVYKEMKRGIFLLALSGCLLLAGCQKETEAKKGQADVSGNVSVATTDEIGNIEALDIELGKDMTVISVLGKEELAIETERIYGVESELGYLDNRFTPEEIDIILNAIEGTWIVDEYVGFVPYENSIWAEEEGTEEEKQKKYDDDRERAKRNLPDFSFQIKSHNSEEFADGGQYIYVYNDNRLYASPMSVVLSMQEKDGYLECVNRTIKGSNISKINGYPVIYIDFFSIFCFQEEVFYEPATLILASDGNYLLLKDGAFYSLKSSIQSRIMSGDFSCLTNANWEDMQNSYAIGAGNNFFEWCQIDLNGDGIEDLILQEKDTVGENINRHIIRGIFACQKDEASCILWDDVDNTEYFFCGLTGELMYSASSYGGVVSEEPYSHYYFDEEWNKIADYTLVVYCIDAAMNEEYAEKWKQEHPDMAEDGIYYRKYTEEGVEVLTRKELENIYEMDTGYEFYSEFY